LAVVDELSPTTTVSEQVAQALFAAPPPFLLPEPGMHFGGFLSWSRKVRLRGDSTRHAANENLRPKPSRPRDGSSIPNFTRR